MLNAHVAVLCFFIVSGFYMALVINTKYARDDAPWISTFYRARFLRLAPAYIAVMLFTVGWYTWTGIPNVFTNSPAEFSWLDRALLILMNVFVVGQDLFQLVSLALSQGTGVEYVADFRDALPPSFFGAGWMVIIQAWSLSSEIFFYVLAPFVVRSPARVVALLVASLMVRWFLSSHLGLWSGIWGYCFFPAALCFFLLGSLAYHAHIAIAGRVRSVAIGWAALAGITVWFLWAVAAYHAVLPHGPDWAMDLPRFWIAYAIFAIAVPFIFSATKDLGVDRVLGEMSYPLYLSHGLMLVLCFQFAGLERSTLIGLSVAIVSFIAAAMAMYLCIDLPFERARARKTRFAMRAVS